MFLKVLRLTGLTTSSFTVCSNFVKCAFGACVWVVDANEKILKGREGSQLKNPNRFSCFNAEFLKS